MRRALSICIVVAASGFPVAASAAPCTQETLAVEGSPVTIGYCVNGPLQSTGAGEVVVPVTATYSAPGGSYQRALELRPGYSGALLNRANALVRSGKLEEAITDYRAVMEAAPSDPLPKQALARALLLRARQLSAQGQPEQARRLMDEAKQLDPSLKMP